MPRLTHPTNYKLYLSPQVRESRDLVEILAKANNNSLDSDSIHLWDFSGYNSITTERVPELSQKVPMKWYLDSSHYNTEVGDLILELMLNNTQTSANITQDFGTVIDQNNIEKHLEILRTEQADYRQKNPQLIQKIEKLLK
ncbi:hypothetical protein [Crocosphaera sp. XPORK-15E]|uniref:hypothetical protein n=1 Tax=Crocosphaera sp. XPORK-15E TaxID=3110247 RepID=UPI002B213BBA|nr:hypothetical protein [Crocosphaera sp. XPORK-15E]MEA5534507.1 hypothetical protein [Crocosphaera sp. XPORK-15E]